MARLFAALLVSFILAPGSSPLWAADPAPGYCGPAALSALFSVWGVNVSEAELGKELYSPAMQGSLGFDLWRAARKEKLIAVEIQPLTVEALKRLNAQGVPVMAGLVMAKLKTAEGHFILIKNSDRGAWVIDDGHDKERWVSKRWLAKRWVPNKQWALVVFPPDRRLEGLGASGHLQAAEQAVELDKREAAVWNLDKAVAIDPKDANFWFRVGSLRRQLGVPGAETAYRTSAALDPESPDALNNLADLLASDPSRKKEAADLAREAIRRASKPPFQNRLPTIRATLAQIES